MEKPAKFRLLELSGGSEDFSAGLRICFSTLLQGAACFPVVDTGRSPGQAPVLVARLLMDLSVNDDCARYSAFRCGCGVGEMVVGFPNWCLRALRSRLKNCIQFTAWVP